MEKNKIGQGLYVIVLATIILSLYPLLHKRSGYFQEHFKTFTLITSVDSTEGIQEEEVALIHTVDQILEEDSLLTDTSSLNFQAELPPTPLYHFKKTLSELAKRRKKVRIAYFGDSIIEGDLVTQTLREHLQKQFGGQGVGFVSITSIAPGFRQTIKHTFSDSWKTYSLVKTPGLNGYGISGEVFMVNSTNDPEWPWVHYEGSSISEGTETFNQIQLFYGNTGSNSPYQPVVQVESDLASQDITLPISNVINRVWLNRIPTQSINVKFQVPENLPLFGLSFEQEDGIYVDNFSSRGNSGMNLIEIPGEYLQGFNEYLAYDLIILHFGLNVVAPNRKNYKSYEKGMTRVINHMKTNLPGAEILMVGVSDKSTRKGGKYMTEPSVPILVNAQQKVARETEIAFYNLYEEMGGKNSMVKWVDQGLANKDFTHFNREGAARVGKMLSDYLLASQPDSSYLSYRITAEAYPSSEENSLSAVQ
ncbi:MAG: hypothetical protein AAF824_00195 [Bacteroidota bacterium]